MTVTFGISLLLSSLAPVEGEVSLVRSHSVMAVRSYVKPSSVLTGSVMISAVIGHIYSLSTFAATDAPAAPAPLPPRVPSRFRQAPVASEAAVRVEGVTRCDLRASTLEYARRKFPVQVPPTRSFGIFRDATGLGLMREDARNAIRFRRS